MSVVMTNPTPGFLAYASFRQFSVAEYHKMIEAGVFTSGEPFELLEGYVVKKMSRGTPHDGAMDRLEGLLLDLLPKGWFLRSQRAITLADSEPEPDIAIVRGPRGRYDTSHPLPTDIGLVIEVSDSSLAIDRHDKTRIYARAGMVAYWIVNIADRQIEVYSTPSGTAYSPPTVYASGDSVPVMLDGTQVGTIAVADVIP